MNRIWAGLAALSAMLLTPAAAAEDCTGLSGGDDPCVGIHDGDASDCIGAYVGGLECVGWWGNGTNACIGYATGSLVQDLTPIRCVGAYWDSSNWLSPECIGIYASDCDGIELLA